MDILVLICVIGFFFDECVCFLCCWVISGKEIFFDEDWDVFCVVCMCGCRIVDLGLVVIGWFEWILLCVVKDRECIWIGLFELIDWL